MARQRMLLSSAVLWLAIGATSAHAQATAESLEVAATNPLVVVEKNRSSVIARIVADWKDALEQLPQERRLSPEQLSVSLWALRSDRLLAASMAGSLAAIESLLAEDRTGGDGLRRVTAKNLGDAAADLTYTPVNPCRIVDTRRPGGGGPLVANTARTFNGFAADFSTQGGTASNCGMPNGVAAIAMNVYAVNPTNLGFIKVWPANAAEPAVSTVNYQVGITAIATGAIVPVDSANSNGFSVKSPAQVDFIADVVGYFRAPSGVVQPAHVLWVAKSGGNYTSIQAAIDAAAAGASNLQRYLVKIAPGIYTEQVTLKDYVDVEGSGPRTTFIFYSAASPTVTAGAFSEMRELSVFNSRNAAFPGANAIAQSANGANGSTILNNIGAFADGATDNVAVYVTGGALFILNSVVQAARSGTQTGTEVGLWASGATADVVVRASILSADSGTTRQSAHQESGGSIRIANTELDATTFGTPLCFQNFVGATLAAAACP